LRNPPYIVDLFNPELLRSKTRFLTPSCDGNRKPTWRLPWSLDLILNEPRSFDRFLRGLWPRW